MKAYLVIVALLMIPLAGALVDEDECSKIFYFILSHLNESSDLEYTDLDFEILKQELELDPQNLTNYISNYTNICEPLTGLKLPSILKDDLIGEINKVYDYDCQVEINKTFLFGAFDFDWTIPFPTLYVGDLGCDEINFQKWLIRIEPTGAGGYEITGLKFWVLMFPLFIVLIGVFINDWHNNNRLRRKIDKEFP